MRKIILFIHGWSESSDCFKHAHEFLHSCFDLSKYQINFADFITMDDSITFSDLVIAMQTAWKKHDLPLDGKHVDIITHSTGALVLRAWLKMYFPNGGSPIRHLIMFAPPNFGSHLAHLGGEFYSRLYKGFNRKHPFEVGQNLLNSLELGSNFLNELAEFDCFSDNTSFQVDDILTTVFIGSSGYNGLAAIANVQASDGVVPIASTSLSPQKLIINYDSNDEVYVDLKTSKSMIAYKIFPYLNHSTILSTSFSNLKFRSYFRKALTVTSTEYEDYCANLAKENKAYSRICKDLFLQQTIIKVKNQFNEPVPDYFLEFAADNCKNLSNMNSFHDDFLKNVHCNRHSPDIRVFTFDTDVLQPFYMNSRTKIDISLTAMPSLEKSNASAGYISHDVINSKALIMQVSKLRHIFKPFSTLLVDWTINRELKSNIFTFHEDHSHGISS